jgi:hypothetical protein
MGDHFRGLAADFRQGDWSGFARSKVGLWLRASGAHCGLKGDDDCEDCEEHNSRTPEWEPIGRGFAREFGEPGSEQSAWAGGGRQLGVHLVIACADKIGDRRLQRKHALTAGPAGFEVPADFGLAARREFSIGGEDKIFMGQVH